MQTLESAVMPSLTLVVGEKLYTVAFPLSCVIQAENKTGLSLKTLRDWLNAPWSAIPGILAAGLVGCGYGSDGADDVAHDICEQLGPEGISSVHEALCTLAFPRAMAELDELVRKRRDKDASPNV
jgi:hypothetical protein